MAHPDIRPATPEDLPDLIRLVKDLATYEKEPDAAVATEEDFRAALFPTGKSASPMAWCHVAEAGEGDVLSRDAGASKGRDRQVVGMALWFLTFSTWTGRHGIHLEDLYVEPRHRGSGLGKALLETLAQECRDRGYPRLEWSVLRWNAPSIAFYDSLDATPQDGWLTYRLDGDALEALGRDDD
ncbi:GNAT family N-acetyltransferase [Janibacter sp. FSL W8-0316]|uniref:GNAT family N-acetyltransferase n=1 Tax=Janibacter sp. FSL W8-0316 TaxID=2975325 RepID=UPI0030FBBDB8